MDFYTYIYRDPTRDNEPIYVGKGKGSRSKVHLRRTDKHPFVQRLQYLAKQNVKPSIEVISAIDEKHSFFLEECLIDIIGRKDLGKGSLLNLTNGGDGASGTVVSDETKAKLKATQHLRGMNGRRHSLETKQLLSKIVTGIIKGPRPEEVKAKIASAKQLHPHQYTPEQLTKMRRPRGPLKNPPAKLQCAHCGIITRPAQLSRWHNDNCSAKTL
jgi:hypothetical protein